MKKNFTKLMSLMLTVSALTLSSCHHSNNDDPIPPAPSEIKEMYVDDSNINNSKWHYISLATKEIVGSDFIKSDEGNLTKWGALKNWDIAINRYKVRTNSGVVTSVGASGGVYTFDAATTFDKVKKVPANAKFEVDSAQKTPGMGKTTIEKRSKAYVIYVIGSSEGMKYEPTPVYIFRSADGKKYYKLLFTQYFNDQGHSGNVKFKYIEINK